MSFLLWDHLGFESAYNAKKKPNSMAVFILQLVKRQNVAILCKLALTVNFLACCFTFQTLGLARQNYQVWLAIFFLIGRTNNFAPDCLALLFLVGNCLAKPGVWNVKQQVKLLTVNASLQMVVLSLDTFRCAFALGKWSLHSRWNLIPACVCLSKKNPMKRQDALYLFRVLGNIRSQIHKMGVQEESPFSLHAKWPSHSAAPLFPLGRSSCWIGRTFGPYFHTPTDKMESCPHFR